MYLHAFHQILVIYFLFPAYVVINNMVIRIDVIYPFSEKENLPPYCIVVVVLCNNVVVDSTYLVCTYQFKTLSRLTKKSEVTELLFGKSIIDKWHLTYYWLNKKSFIPGLYYLQLRIFYFYFLC